MRKLYLFLIVFSLLVVGASDLYACRIVPTRPVIIIRPYRPYRPIIRPIQVKSHHFQTTIKDGVATTVLESVFYNPNGRVLEGTYLFPLPKGASVSKYALWINGKPMEAELLDAKKARNIYLSIVRRMIDPGLLEFVGRETFKMRVYPFPAYGTRKIRLSYQQLLPVDGNLMRYVYPLTTVGNGRNDILGKLSFHVKISSQIPIKSIFSPSHKIKVVKEDKSATVSFEQSNAHPDRDFVLYISRSMKNIDLSFVPYCKKGEKGYFLLMLSPKSKIKSKETNPKDVVFVLDTSGSMVGDKIKQAKAALKYCVQQLNAKDNFNIIPFATEASRYKDKLIPASEKNVKAALEFIDEYVRARGGTNIEEALSYAMEMAPKSSSRPFMVIFLTDGKPTIGTRDAKEILKKVQKTRPENLRLFSFGIGERINTKLVDLLAEENNGTREYVGSREDIEVKVSSFFDKVSSPVLSNIKVHFPSSDSLRVDQTYPRKFRDLFKGSRLVMLGRYKGNGDQAIRVTGFVNGKKQEFVFETTFPEQRTENAQIPRLWAVRKVGYLLDQIRLHGENSEVKKEIVFLAKKFGIVTPYTSYLVVEDEATTPIRRNIRPMISRRVFRPSPKFAGKTRSAMEDESGKAAFDASRELKAMKKAESAYSRPQGIKDGRDSVHNQIRKIDEKTFYMHNSVWYDSEYDNNQGLPKTRVKYMSKEYFKLLEKNPGMGKFLAIGAKLVLVWNKRLYEIY